MNEISCRKSADDLRAHDFAPLVGQRRKHFVGREWLFERIDAWRGSGEARVLLIQGGPGVGKSALAAQLVHLNPGGQVLAYHFCQAEAPETLRPGRFVRSLAAMIADRLDAYATRLQDPSIQDALGPLRCEQDPLAALEEGILAPLGELVSPEDGTRYILIDALDNALGLRDLAGKPTIVQLLSHQLDHLPPWVRVVATTRDEQPVLDQLSGLEAQAIDVEDDRNGQDLDRYVAARLDGENLAGRLAASGLARESVVAVLRAKSAGNFLYAQQALEGVERGQYAFEALETLPTGVSGLYREFFEHSFPDEKDYAQARRLLEVILAAREPLAEAELAAAAGLDEENELPAVLRSLSGHLWKRAGFERAACYTLFHESLADWLADPEQCGAAYHADAKRGHERLADVGWNEYQKGPASMSSYARLHLPAHLASLSHWDDLEQLLTDVSYLEAVTEAGSLLEIARSFTIAVHALPADRPGRRTLRLLEEALRRDLPFIAQHPGTLFQCLWNTCWWYDCPEASAHYVAPQAGPPSGAPAAGQAGQALCELLQAWRTTKEARAPAAWVRSLRPPPTNLGAGRQAVLRGHERGVLGVAFSPDGRRIASGALDNTVRVWDAGAGTEIRCLRGHERGVRGVAYSPGGRRIATASMDRTVRVWDANRGDEIRSLGGHARDVTSVAYGPDGRQIATGSLDQTVRLWDAETGAELRCLRGHESAVLSVAFSPDGRRIVSGSKDQTVRVWDPENAAQLLCLRGPASDVTSVACSPDRRRIIAASKDQTVRVWDAETGAELRCLRGHARDVTSVACSPDGRRIVTGSLDQTVRVWDAESGTELRCFEGHVRDVTSVAYSPDGRGIASGSWDEAIRVWDAESTAELRSLCGHEDWVRALVYRKDGRQLVSGSVDRTVRVWDAQNGTELFCLRGHARDVVSLAYSPDGRQIASGSFDKTVRVWDAETGLELRCLHGHRSSVYSVAYSPDGRRLVSGSLDQTVRIWDAETGAELRILHGHDYWVLNAVYSPDGRRIVSAALDQTVRVWDAETGRELHCLRGHEMDVTVVACSPDGRRIVSGSLDQTVRVWDAETGAELRCLRGHERGVLGLAYSADGRRIVSGSFDQTLRVWDAETAECLERLQGQGDVAAIADDAPRSAWKALARGAETVIVGAGTPEPIARFPVPLDHIITHPTGRTWAGANGSHVYLITLEGAVETPAS